MRLHGWEERFAVVVDGALDKPYRLGEWDCLRLACATVHALTGRDHWHEFAGQYDDYRSALRAILHVSRDLPGAITRTTGIDPSPMTGARRGDLVLYADAVGQEHIGVCLGATVGVLGPEGLEQVPLLHAGCRMAWGVG